METPSLAAWAPSIPIYGDGWQDVTPIRTIYSAGSPARCRYAVRVLLLPAQAVDVRPSRFYRRLGYTPSDCPSEHLSALVPGRLGRYIASWEKPPVRCEWLASP